MGGGGLGAARNPAPSLALSPAATRDSSEETQKRTKELKLR